MSLISRNDSKPVRTQRTAQDDTFFKCRWENCEKVCRTAAGRVQHERLIHRSTDTKFICPKCNSSFKENSQLTNHEKSCGKQKSKVACNQCGKTMLKTSLKKHREKNCQGGKVANEPEEERQFQLPREHCTLCHKVIAKTNMSRHRRDIHGAVTSAKPGRAQRREEVGIYVFLKNFGYFRCLSISLFQPA